MKFSVISVSSGVSGIPRNRPGLFSSSQIKIKKDHSPANCVSHATHIRWTEIRLNGYLQMFLSINLSLFFKVINFLSCFIVFKKFKSDFAMLLYFLSEVFETDMTMWHRYIFLRLSHLVFLLLFEDLHSRGLWSYPYYPWA